MGRTPPSDRIRAVEERDEEDHRIAGIAVEEIGKHRAGCPAMRMRTMLLGAVLAFGAVSAASGWALLTAARAEMRLEIARAITEEFDRRMPKTRASLAIPEAIANWQQGRE